MARSLFLILLFSFIGVILNPGYLAADQIIELKQPKFNAALTVIPKPIIEDKITPQTVQYKPQIRSSVNTTPPTYTPPANSITIAGRTIEIINASSIVESGNKVIRYTGYGGKLYYGHNTSSVFGGLSSLAENSTFIIRNDGIETTYRIMRKEYYQKTWDTPYGEITYKNDGINHMNSVANGCFDSHGKKDCAFSYHITLMTCHGQPLKGGDATERLVIFANAI